MPGKNVYRIHPEYKSEENPFYPAQYNLFTEEPEAVPIIIEEQPEGEIRVDERVTISSDLIEELCLRGITLHFLSGMNKPYAMVTSHMLTATIEARREQIEAIKDQRSLELSKAIVFGKITNQERLLRYFGKYIKGADLERFKTIESLTKELRKLREKVKTIIGNHINEKRNTLIGIEGTAGRLYWDRDIDPKVEFFGRQTKGAIDPLNSLFNYGYGILYSTVWGSLVNAGLEPFAGFLHVDRPGKPSLVLDLIEEFRQPVVDRVVIAHVKLGQDIKITDGLLDADTRKIIGEKILGKLESVETYKGKKYQIRSIIQMQARNLASFFNKSGCSLIPNEEGTMRRAEVQKSVRKKAIGVKRKGIF